MRLHFHIRYKARWGESLCILGEASPIICWTENQPLRMQCRGEEDWHAETELPDSIRQISYHYAVLQNDGRYLHEQKPIRNVLSDSAASCLFLNDYWQEADIERIFASAVFAGVFFARGQQKTFGTTKPSKTKKPASPIEENLSANTKHLRLRLHLFAAQIEPDQGLAVVGNIPELGEWETARKQALSDQHYPNWQIELPIGTPQKSIEYKYVVYRLADGEILDYENGENRRIEITGQESLVRCQDFGSRRTKAAWKGAGTAIPVFSLRSRQSFGIGEFPDLKILGEWAVATRQKIIQTLPVNDTTLYHNRHDSYPYNAVSVMALNPNYLNIEKMGKLPTKMLRQYRKTQSELNAKSFVDYQVVADEKKHYFLYLYRQESNKLFASEAYRVFWEKNREWLKTYAAFSYLRDRFGTPDFRQWPRYSRYYADEIEALCAPESEAYKDIAFYYFLQFHADAQLTEAKNHLRRLCIALKGDIPIGISPDSVEAWSRPEEFNLNCQAGAPPDEFSISGQNWGFPTYNWDIMARNHYEWWRKRFLKMAEYFDAFRIDHILGFFRIWEMSTDEVWGLKGRFSPALPYTGEELRHQGICMDTERLLQPYIHEDFLPDVFGEDTDYVKTTFLDDTGHGLYAFKPAFDTQQKIKSVFEDSAYSPVFAPLTASVSADLPAGRKEKIRNGLYRLHCEVLFVRDLHHPDKLHPRIALYQSHSFLALPTEQQQKLRALHDDFFYHRHNAFWKESALQKLPALLAETDMLVCGEDLGMVPASVPEVMKQLNILSLEIQRMPKDPACEFGDPAKAPYLSVCSTGTHDTNPLRAWWEEDAGKTQRFYHRLLAGEGDAPRDCSPDIVEAIIEQHLQSPAIWVILPLQDWLALDETIALKDCHAERINVPDNPENFWCYRMHLSLEELLAQRDFNQRICKKISIAGR